MIQIGQINTLTVTSHTDFGIYLGEEGEESILLPEKYLPEDEELWEVGKQMDVFVYLDSEDRPVATTEEPIAMVGECAFLQVVGKSTFGSFVDWGLSKDLLVPFKEQRVPMHEGRSYVVYIYLDKSDRIAATSRLGRYLKEENQGHFDFREEVDLLIVGKTDLGYKAVINGTHIGLIHQNEVVRSIRAGDEFKGYIGVLRDDKRINLTLQKMAYEMREELSEKILAYLQENGGIITLTDKSPPGEINAVFQVSKSNYKKALGKLFKEGKITFYEKTVRLNQDD